MGFKGDAMTRWRRFLLVLLNVCIITILMLPANAGALTTKKMAFLILETSTKVMAEGILRFKEEYPALAKKVDIMVCPCMAVENVAEPDLSDSDIIFLHPKNYKLMLDMENDLKMARARGAKVIGIGGYDVFRVKGYYNVDINDYPQIDAYWHYSGSENVKRLIVYLLTEFCGVSGITPDPPVETPLEGIYHPDAPGSKVFETLESYLKWYKISGRLKDAPRVGLLAYNTLKANDNMVEDAIIRQLEKQGLNVVCTIGHPADEKFQKYLLKNGSPQVDIVVSLMFSHPKEKSVKLLAGTNIPVIRAVLLYNKIEEWEENPQGIEAFQLASRIFLPELSGLIEPVVVGGQRIFFDEKTGVKVTERVPVNERIEKLVKRTKLGS